MAISFSCVKCGKKFKVGEEMAGHKGRCPKCGKSFRVPESAVVRTKKAAASNAAALFAFETQPGEGILEDYVPSTPGQRPPPPANRRGFPYHRVIVYPFLVVLFLAAVTAVGLMAAETPLGVKIAGILHIPTDKLQGWVLSAPEIEDDLRYLPDKSKTLFILDVKNLVHSDVYAKAEKEGLDQKLQLTPELSFEDVHRVTIAIGEGGDVPMAAVVRFSKPVSVAMIQAMPNLSKLSFTSETVRGHSVYESDNLAFCPVGDRGFAFARPAVLRAILERKQRNHLSQPMQKALAGVDRSQLVLAMIVENQNVEERIKDLLSVLGQSANLSLDTPIDGQMGNIESAALELDVGNEVALQVNVHCKTAETAEELDKKADLWLDTANKVLSLLAKEAPKDLLKMNHEVFDRRLHVGLETSSDKLKEAIKNAASRWSGKMNEKKKE